MTILDAIVEQKRLEVARLPPRTVSIPELCAALDARGERRDFLGALLDGAQRPPAVASAARTPGPKAMAPTTVGRPPVRPSIALIAEVKKASPSAGLIRPDFDPVRIAREYEAAGASCLSVLTDEKFFQGSLQYLRQIRSAVKLPLLRKDFIIDERQVLEAAEWGADAILLIVAILGRAELEGLLALASGAGLAALVEVHDELELDRALEAGATLIGVNNRNLKTFKVDLATTERLAARLASSSLGAPRASRPAPGAPPSGGSTVDTSPGAARAPRPVPLLVAESGIHSRDDVERLARCGARAILVGESLMRHPDLGDKVRELLGT
jgi:indole-3-glycerol phosphate synthase